MCWNGNTFTTQLMIFFSLFKKFQSKYEKQPWLVGCRKCALGETSSLNGSLAETVRTFYRLPQAPKASQKRGKERPVSHYREWFALSCLAQRATERARIIHMGRGLRAGRTRDFLFATSTEATVAHLPD